ncbi:MAG: phosphotransferase [Alphaproteobacteria bacterium]|nr:phosphotransferase [Alphaproteobacteria bacterium]MBV8548735.1 phosphotransferase [Alphaproteobacteria bacterium]
MNRALEIADFLGEHGWEDAVPTSLPADWASRHYARLNHPDGRIAILMDAPPEQKTPEYVMIARLLTRIGLHAPEIYAAAPLQGLVLMEDLGARNIGHLLDQGEAAAPYLKRCITVLAHLHQNWVAPAPHEAGPLPRYTTTLFAEQAGLFIDYYAPSILNRDITPDEKAAFDAAWHSALRPISQLPQNLMLRDFMPDNVMDLSDRLPSEAVTSIGLVDFQDAGVGPVAYDIASLCEIVRRAGGDQLLPQMQAHYISLVKPDYEAEDLRRACVILSAQRHMRIIGIITRLAQNGRPEKQAYLPRIRAQMQVWLRDPALAAITKWLEKVPCL